MPRVCEATLMLLTNSVRHPKRLLPLSVSPTSSRSLASKPTWHSETTLQAHLASVVPLLAVRACPSWAAVCRLQLWLVLPQRLCQALCLSSRGRRHQPRLPPSHPSSPPPLLASWRVGRGRASSTPPPLPMTLCPPVSTLTTVLHPCLVIVATA